MGAGRRLQRDGPLDLANARFRSQESHPIRVTIALVGEPSLEALDRLDARNGLVQLDLRASSEATDTFLSVTGLEAFLPPPVMIHAARPADSAEAASAIR